MTNYDLIYKIDNIARGLSFSHIEGTSLVGDPLSDASKHPIQYRALTTILPGNDDPYEGIGWTPNEALRDLWKKLKYIFD